MLNKLSASVLFYATKFHSRWNVLNGEFDGSVLEMGVSSLINFQLTVSVKRFFHAENVHEVARRLNENLPHIIVKRLALSPIKPLIKCERIVLLSTLVSHSLLVAFSSTTNLDRVRCMQFRSRFRRCHDAGELKVRVFVGDDDGEGLRWECQISTRSLIMDFSWKSSYFPMGYRSSCYIGNAAVLIVDINLEWKINNTSFHIVRHAMRYHVNWKSVGVDISLQCAVVVNTAESFSISHGKVNSLQSKTQILSA